MLMLYRRVIFGKAIHEDAMAMKDLTPREFGLLVPLALAVIWLGVFPGTIMDKIAPSVEKLVEDFNSKISLNVEPASGPIGDIK